MSGEDVSVADRSDEQTASEVAAAEQERQRQRKLMLLTAILFIGLPIYLIVASVLAAALRLNLVGAEAPGWWVLIELVIYLGLGMLWAFPLKNLTMGVGKKRG